METVDMRVLMIYRAERYSPNSVVKDRQILDAVGHELRECGAEVLFMCEESLTDYADADVIFSMGRCPDTIEWLARKEEEGVRVINSSCGMRSSRRSFVDRMMRENAIPAAPQDGNCGYWLKRGDGAAQQKEDVVFAVDEAERDRRLEDFMSRGIRDVVTTAHVRGDLVKFYGVAGTPFFRCYYPTDDGGSKFGDECRNGKAMHYDFSRRLLMENATRLAGLLGLEVYGGDCIVRQDGTFAIIDFNDWPSFSRCRNDAAKAIASLACAGTKESHL